MTHLITSVAFTEKTSGLIKKMLEMKKLFFITLDNASSNDVCVKLLKNQILLINLLVYNGKLLCISCFDHLLNLIVQGGLKQLDVVVEKRKNKLDNV